MGDWNIEVLRKHGVGCSSKGDYYSLYHKDIFIGDIYDGSKIEYIIEALNEYPLIKEKLNNVTKSPKGSKES